MGHSLRLQTSRSVARDALCTTCRTGRLPGHPRRHPGRRLPRLDAHLVQCLGARIPKPARRNGASRPCLRADLRATSGLAVLGPSLHAYTDVDPGTVSGVGRTDLADLAVLRDAVTPSEWSEGGFADDDPAVCFVLHDTRGEVVAVHTHGIARWRALETNAASRAIARPAARLGPSTSP